MVNAMAEEKMVNHVINTDEPYAQEALEILKRHGHGDRSKIAAEYI
jgi:hypothetical protein